MSPAFPIFAQRKVCTRRRGRHRAPPPGGLAVRLLTPRVRHRCGACAGAARHDAWPLSSPIARNVSMSSRIGDGSSRQDRLEISPSAGPWKPRRRKNSPIESRSHDTSHRSAVVSISIESWPPSSVIVGAGTPCGRGDLGQLPEQRAAEERDVRVRPRHAQETRTCFHEACVGAVPVGQHFWCVFARATRPRCLRTHVAANAGSRRTVLVSSRRSLGIDATSSLSAHPVGPLRSSALPMRRPTSRVGDRPTARQINVEGDAPVEDRRRAVVDVVGWGRIIPRQDTHVDVGLPDHVLVGVVPVRPVQWRAHTGDALGDVHTRPSRRRPRHTMQRIGERRGLAPSWPRSIERTAVRRPRRGCDPAGRRATRRERSRRSSLTSRLAVPRRDVQR